jgi:hypothetical protein
MKNETEKNQAPSQKLTRQTLKKLKEKGFMYVQVKSLSWDRRPDYLQPKFMILTPVKELPKDPDQRGIYEPINSRILTDWADSPDIGFEVMVADAG